MKRIITTLIATLALVTLTLAPTAVADHSESKSYTLSTPVTFESDTVHHGATLSIADDTLDSTYVTVTFYLDDEEVGGGEGCGPEVAFASPEGWNQAVVQVGPAQIALDTLDVCPGGTTGTITLIGH